jgi:hypothetical protein
VESKAHSHFGQDLCVEGLGLCVQRSGLMRVNLQLLRDSRSGLMRGRVFKTVKTAAAGSCVAPTVPSDAWHPAGSRRSRSADGTEG